MSSETQELLKEMPSNNVVASTSIYCPNCGNVATGKFCARCGALIPVPGTNTAPTAYSQPKLAQTQNSYGSVPASNMYKERQKLLKEIRDKQKKMTVPATARIIKKENDPAYVPHVDNILNNRLANTNWAKYEFEVDGKTYYGHAAVHPLHGKRIRIVYNPEDPAQSRSRSSAVIDKMHRPVFILLIAVLIPIIMILVLRFLGIRFW